MEDRSPSNRQVAHRIGPEKNLLVLLVLRQTEPFGSGTPTGEETANPVVCFFIVESEICFQKYRKHWPAFYISIGLCMVGSSWTVRVDMFTACLLLSWCFTTYTETIRHISAENWDRYCVVILVVAVVAVAVAVAEVAMTRWSRSSTTTLKQIMYIYNK